MLPIMTVLWEKELEYKNQADTERRQANRSTPPDYTPTNWLERLTTRHPSRSPSSRPELSRPQPQDACCPSSATLACS